MRATDLERGPNRVAKPASGEAKVGFGEDFCGWKKSSGTAPGMIFEVGARRGVCEWDGSSLKAWWRTWKLAIRVIGLLTAGTGGRRCGRRGLSEERLPIQQSEDTLPSGFGGGTEPAEIANALKAFGQHMLKEAAEKLRSGQGESAPIVDPDCLCI